jgi:putative phosphoribosyl transferase
MPIVEKQWTTTIEQAILIEADSDVRLRGELSMPEECFGLALYAHGSDMGRSCSGSLRTVRELEEQGLAVLTFDLLKAAEEDEEIRTGVLPIDLRMMASRFLEAAAWAGRQPELHGLPIGLVGSGTAATAALIAAAEAPAGLGAVVCRSGRVDQADGALAHVKAPTLLIVGAEEASMVRSNEAALLRLGSSRKELVMIPGGIAGLEGPREQVTAAELTAEWLSQNLILAAC